MSHAVTIPVEEMRSAFAKTNSQGQGWTETVVGNELVFDWEFHPMMVVRVFTSFGADRYFSRSSAHDCIRVAAVDFRNPATPKGYISSARVLRVEGWKANLKIAITDTYHAAVNRLQIELAAKKKQDEIKQQMEGY